MLFPYIFNHIEFLFITPYYLLEIHFLETPDESGMKYIRGNYAK